MHNDSRNTTDRGIWRQRHFPFSELGTPVRPRFRELFLRGVSSEWLQLVMISERPAIQSFSKSAFHQTIYYPAWPSMHIALPPFAEQHRIVARVDESMVPFNQLETALTAADTTRAHLLDALLHEALTPAARTVTEAAE